MPVEAERSKYLRPIRKGEYTIANILTIGRDPTDGRSFDQCHDEWKRAVDRISAESDATPRWRIFARMRLNMQTYALATHLGDLAA